MQPLKELICTSLLDAFQRSFPEHLALSDMVADSLSYSTHARYGHYQCNVAMRLAKQLKMNPKEIAQSITSNLNDSLYSQIEIAGPGFINLWLQASLLSNYARHQLTDSHLGVLQSHPRQKVVIDFSSPNIAKEMHVGHLRSTIIGDCIANIFEFYGDDVLRLNHVGDWGTAFGMLIVYLQEQHPTILADNTKTDLSQLVVWYKAAKQQFDADPRFKERAQQQVVKLQSGDHDSLLAWEKICDISRSGFQRVYDILDIKITERGESYYNDQLDNMIAQLEEKNLIQVSDGAKCIFLDGFVNRNNEPLPLMVQKSDGGYNYASTDMAAVQQRVDIEQADRIIYLTDSGQSQHFAQVFAAAAKAGFVDKNHTQLDHAGFGLVLGEDGKKFRTRSGETVRLQNLLDEAILKAKNILLTRDRSWGEDDLNAAAHILGIGAVKYADLSCSRINDYKFSFDRMLQFEGNTASFIIYAYVRIQSIRQKIENEVANTQVELLSFEHPSEISLGLHLARFPDVMAKIKADLMPHYLTDYLYETAQLFNLFFRDCRVVGSDKQASRWLICELTAKMIRTGLNLLGIKTLNRM